jgi:hypothetical protein
MPPSPETLSNPTVPPLACYLAIAWLAAVGIGYATTLFGEVLGTVPFSVDLLMPSYGLALAGVLFALATGRGKRAEEKEPGKGGTRHGG